MGDQKWISKQSRPSSNWGSPPSEARVYLGLLQQSPITGYQLSKLSGVPRSRVYETLERLTAKRYAVALQTEPAKYGPLAARELLAHFQEQFDGALSTLGAELKQIRPQATESIWNLRGRDDILRRARAMVAQAQDLIYLVGWRDTLRTLQPELEAAARRGIRIVVISCGEGPVPSERTISTLLKPIWCSSATLRSMWWWMVWRC